MEDRPHSGHMSVALRDQDRYVQNTHLHIRFQTDTGTAANTHGTHNNRISAQTVSNRLREGGLSSCCVLARHQCVNCVNWVHSYHCWLKQQWNSVLFSDESRSTIHQGDGRVQVYHRRNESNANCWVLERDRFWGGGVLSWPGLALHLTFALILLLLNVI